MRQDIKVCAWCPDKEERDKEEASKWNRVTHIVCEECNQKVLDFLNK